MNSIPRESCGGKDPSEQISTGTAYKLKFSGAVKAATLPFARKFALRVRPPASAGGSIATRVARKSFGTRSRSAAIEARRSHKAEINSVCD